MQQMSLYRSRIASTCTARPSLILTRPSVRLATTNASAEHSERRNITNASLWTTWSARFGSRRSSVATPVRIQCYGTSTNRAQAAVHCDIREHRPGHDIAILTISNPRKLNIVSTPLLLQIVERCEELSTIPSVRAVVLTGGETAPGKAPAFIGGADITEMHQLASSDDARQFITRVHLACKAIRDLPVPVVARVDGYSLGAGLEIMAACDLRIATKTSIFAMPEVKVGIPSVVEAALLPGLIGMGRTRRLLYLAENIDALTADTWGLVDCPVPDVPSLDITVQEWVSKICEAGPEAIKEQKRLMRKWEDCSTAEGIAAGIDSFASAFEDGGIEPNEYMGHFLKSKAG